MRYLVHDDVEQVKKAEEFIDDMFAAGKARYCETTVTFDRALKTSKHVKIL